MTVTKSYIDSQKTIIFFIIEGIHAFEIIKLFLKFPNYGVLHKIPVSQTQSLKKIGQKIGIVSPLEKYSIPTVG